MTARSDALMKLRGLSRHYEMGDNVVRALSEVELDVLPGDFVVIVGSSGSGKSTLMHILGCLDSPTAGTYRLGDHLVSELPDARLSRVRNERVGFVFQQFNLLPNLTVEENIALPLVYKGMSRRQRLKTARGLAERLGLGDRLHHRPSELSGGQSQRVAIARALVNGPDMIFADEPTGNLDSVTGEEIMDILYDLNDQGYTIVVVTHDPKYATRGSRKITISDGRVVADATGTRQRAPRKDTERTAGAVGRMSLFDLLRIGAREGLLAHKTRTALTMLGIVIGVAGVIAMSSFSLGSKKKQADQIRALGANLVRITDERLEGEKLADARIEGSSGLSLEDMALIRQHVPGIRLTAGSRLIKMNVIADGPGVSPRIVGIAGQYFRVNNLGLAEGRFIETDDHHRSARVAVIGHAIRERLGDGSPLGHVMLIGGTPYTVVGVLADRQIDMEDLEASGANDPNYDLLLPLHTILYRTKYLDMRSELDEIHLQLRTEDILSEAGTCIRRLLKAAHGGVEDFKLVIPLDLLKQKQQSQRLLDILTICISSIALVVGGIGIMNIMLASVTERIREIGVRRAVGATQRDIKLQFLSESVLISVTGGLAGIVLALAAVGMTCTALALPIVVSPLMVALAVSAAIATGLVFGSYPAAEAARKDPVEALRYE